MHNGASGALDWYDAAWLRAYYDAQGVLERHAPGVLGDFVDAMAVFRTDPAFAARRLPALLTRDELAAVRAEIAAIPRERLEMHELRDFGRFVVHDWEPFTRMQRALTDRMSELAGEPLEPNYNFLSLYTHRGVCAPHLDAPSAKYTLDICIDQSDPWPIHFSPILPWPDLGASTALASGASLPQFDSVILEPGDAVLFSGSSQWHYRDAFAPSGARGFCDLLFFHYIPLGTRDLLKPGNWANIFAVPELDTVETIRGAAY